MPVFNLVDKQVTQPGARNVAYELVHVLDFRKFRDLPVLGLLLALVKLAGETIVRLFLEQNYSFQLVNLIFNNQ